VLCPYGVLYPETDILWNAAIKNLVLQMRFGIYKDYTLSIESISEIIV